MIRKQIIFKTQDNVNLGYSYQYDVMKNIYYYLSVADSVLEKMLHNKGFKAESGHVFKLFNYSLLFDNVEFSSAIKINNKSTVKLILSGKKDIVQKILKGLLHVKKMKIGDNELKLVNIEDDKKFRFNEVMLYKAISPIVETTLDDDKNVINLAPYDSSYFKNLAFNAMRKYELCFNRKFNNKIFFDIDDALKIKQKSFKIKDGYIHGHLYDVWIEATPEMQKVIYYLGLGQNSSTGAGMLTYITSG